MRNFFSFENRTPKYENTGHRMEAELIGDINKKKYDELAFDYIQKKEKQHLKNFEEKATENQPENEFEKILQTRDAATDQFDSFSKIRKKENYINYEKSMSLIEESQYSNPEKPTKFFSAALYNYVKNRFDDKYTLKFYTASGLTHLDILHGVDCFFKLYEKNSNQEITRTSIDLTGNRDKERARADVLIMVNQKEKEQMDSSEINKGFNKEALEAKINEYGEIIVQSLYNNYQEKIKKEELLEMN